MFGPLVLTTVASLISFSVMHADTIPFKTVDRGGQSGIEEPRQVVVRTAADWQKLWKEHAPERPAPTIDFTQSMVVAVFMGYRPTGGYAVEITAIDKQDSAVVVTYRERKPQPSDIVTQVITMPYHLVALNKASGEIRFTRAP